jgi:(S)-ureidoglycine aminohydrolase
MTGFSETFSQYVMEVAPGGGSDAPDPETGAEHWLFFTGGLATLTSPAATEVEAGSYAYIPPDTPWTAARRRHRTHPLPLAAQAL